MATSTSVAKLHDDDKDHIKTNGLKVLAPIGGALHLPHDIRNLFAKICANANLIQEGSSQATTQRMAAQRMAAIAALNAQPKIPCNAQKRRKLARYGEITKAWHHLVLWKWRWIANKRRVFRGQIEPQAWGEAFHQAISGVLTSQGSLTPRQRDRRMSQSFSANRFRCEFQSCR